MKRYLVLFAACVLGVLVLTMPTAAAPARAIPTTQLKGQSTIGHRAAPVRPHGPAQNSPFGAFSLLWDDGYADYSIGWGNSQSNYTAAAIWLNRFDVASFPRPLTLTNIQIVWPGPDFSRPGGAASAATQYVYPDADRDPTNAVRVNSSPEAIVTINIADWNTFETYPVNFTIDSPGDIYVGWEDAWAEGGVQPLHVPGSNRHYRFRGAFVGRRQLKLLCPQRRYPGS